MTIHRINFFPSDAPDAQYSLSIYLINLFLKKNMYTLDSKTKLLEFRTTKCQNLGLGAQWVINVLSHSYVSDRYCSPFNQIREVGNFLLKKKIGWLYINYYITCMPECFNTILDGSTTATFWDPFIFRYLMHLFPVVKNFSLKWFF